MRSDLSRTSFYIQPASQRISDLVCILLFHFSASSSSRPRRKVAIDRYPQGARITVLLHTIGA